MQVTRDECNRADTQLEGLQALKPIRIKEDAAATITAGSASQLSDGASACVLMSEAEVGALKFGGRREGERWAKG